MPVNWNHGEAKRKFQSFVKKVADDDLSARADRVKAQAKTPGFGFQDRSGKLRGSIRKEKIKQPRVAGYRIVAGEGALGNDGNSYAAAVEKGFAYLTKDKKTGDPKVVTVDPHPYLNPALQAGKD